jgi:hypothetical protein
MTQLKKECDMEKEKILTIIDCAEKTIDKYIHWLRHINDPDFFDYVGNFGSPGACAYCREFYPKEDDVDRPSKKEKPCVKCPLYDAETNKHCYDFSTYNSISNYLQKRIVGFTDDELDYNVYDFIEDVEKRIKFHTNIINKYKEMLNEKDN